MGCTSSRLQDSDVIQQCKERRRLMKNAVHLRQEFAIAHFAYIHTLRNVGFALRRFAEGDVSDSHSSPSSPGSPVLPLPQPSSSPLPLLSPPSASPPPTLASSLSLPSVVSPPRQSLPRPSTGHESLPPPSSSPPRLAKSASPPSSPLPVSTSPQDSTHTSPLRHASPSPVENGSSHGDRQEVLSVYSLHGMASPDRASDFSPPFYSPNRGDPDEIFMSFSSSPRGYRTPPPPPSPPPSVASSWFLYDIFNAPPIPYHLQEHRRMKEAGEVDGTGAEEESKVFDHGQEEEGIPELEDEDQKEDTKEKVEQEEVAADMEGGHTAQVVEEKTVVPEEKPEEVSEANTKDAKTEGKAEEEKEAIVPAMETVVSLDGERKEKPKHELSVVTDFKGIDLTGAVRHINNHFSKACRSGQDVSGMLETQMVLHHMSVLDIKESSKVFNAITMHWSRKTTLAMRDAYEDTHIPECGMTGSHALTLERIFAWEKKLYDEVKAGELIRVAFDRKCKQLQNLDATGGDAVAIDKTRAALKKLDTQLLVALKAIHLASVKIQELTRDELYPQLAELLGGLMSMWKVMLECHKAQKAIALEMETLKNSAAGDEASVAHRKATIDLEHELETWQAHFQGWISSQKRYIDVLYEWLSKCQLASETDMQGRHIISSHLMEGVPPIRVLLENWHKSLLRLEKQQEVVDAISNFAAVVHSLEREQSDELGLKRQAERSSRDLDRRTRKLEKRILESSEDSDGKAGAIELHSSAKSNVQERRADLDNFRGVVEDEKHKHFMAVQGRKDTTLSRLQGNLPTVFESMASFAEDALREYENLQQNAELKKSPARQNGVAHHHMYD